MRLLGRGTDARWLIAGGLLVAGAGNYWMSQTNLQISPWELVWPRVVLIIGLSMLFAPISVAAFKYIPMHLRGAAVGLFSLLRNEGGSVGTSMAQTIEERQDQFHTLRMNENLDLLNPAVTDFAGRGQAIYFQATGDPAGSQQMTWQRLSDLRDQQAASLAYFDVFWMTAILAIGLVVLVFLMKALCGREEGTRRSRMRLANESKRSVLLKGGDKPGPCVSPVVVGRSGRDAEDGSGLLDGQAGKVAELDHFRSAWLDGREPVERLIEGEKAWGRIRERDLIRVENPAGEVAAGAPCRACGERIQSGFGAWPRRRRQRSAPGRPSAGRRPVQPAEGRPREPGRWAGACGRVTRRPCAAASFRNSS